MSHNLPQDDARSSPAVARNRDPILEVLRGRLAHASRVLEIASGTGEHAVWFSRNLPHLTWQPTDADPQARASIAAWRAQQGPPNLLAPLHLDAASPATWPALSVNAIVAINMIHISPWAATIGLLEGSAAVLAKAGLLIIYGPFVEADVETAPGNLAFDADLRSRDAAWGLRDLAALTRLAGQHGLALAERIAMPANNLTLVFRPA